MEGLDLARLVSTKNIYDWSNSGKYKVAAVDFGIKRNILRLLESLDCQVTVFPANATAKEILNDTQGKLDAIVMGIGTGGTITGVGEVLKKKNKKIKIIAVEPEDSPVLSGGTAGQHKIQ